MPELPEVETIKRELETALIGKKIVDVLLNNPRIVRGISPGALKQGVKGAVIRAIIRKAKSLILELSNGRALFIHLKMTGQLVYPGTGQNSRVSFVFSGDDILDFNDQRLFAELRLLKDWRSFKFIQKLGLEPFEVPFTGFKKLIAGKKTKIKPLLMDQACIAGIGNLYAAEILFRAKIHPERKAYSLTDGEIKVLFNEIGCVLRKAIACGGSSVDTYVRLSGKRGEYIRYHKVYGREGLPCCVCKTPITRNIVGGRGTYFCRKCQT
ncbi:MAG: DNA-formamidopyrimidine glycosylase [Candidatus Omnitrophica bacterium]|nr:DNA-formamidopyrimidine glycosylase [Candidatus Omnitrophota bacterium]